MKSQLQDNDVEMYSTKNEGKPVVAERFIRTLKKKNYKLMTSMSKNVHISKLDNIVNKYNHTYRTVNTKPVNLKLSTYVDFDQKNNKKDPTFNVGDDVRISEYKKLKIMFHGHVIGDLNWEVIVGTFYKKELQKTNQKEFRVEKVINKKGDKLYIKCRDYNSFNSWIDKKYIFIQKSVIFHLMVIAKRK